VLNYINFTNRTEKTKTNLKCFICLKEQQILIISDGISKEVVKFMEDKKLFPTAQIVLSQRHSLAHLDGDLFINIFNEW